MHVSEHRIQDDLGPCTDPSISNLAKVFAVSRATIHRTLRQYTIWPLRSLSRERVRPCGFPEQVSQGQDEDTYKNRSQGNFEGGINGRQ